MNTIIFVIAAAIVAALITWAIFKAREDENNIQHEAAQIRQFVCMVKQVARWEIYDRRRFVKALVEQFVEEAIHFSPQSFVAAQDCDLKAITTAMAPSYFSLSDWGYDMAVLPPENNNKELKAIMVEEFMKVII